VKPIMTLDPSDMRALQAGRIIQLETQHGTVLISYRSDVINESRSARKQEYQRMWREKNREKIRKANRLRWHRRKKGAKI